MPVAKRLLIAAIVVLGLFALAGRSITPFIDDWRPQIETALSKRLGESISIGSIQARWYGFRPLIELSRITFGAGDGALLIDRAGIEVSPLAALRLLTRKNQDAMTDSLRVTIDGLSVTVVREADDRIHVGSIGPIGGQHDSSVLPLLPNHLELVNTEVVWIDRKRSLPPVTVPEVSVNVARNGTDLAIRARVQSKAGHADASARLTGYLATTEWSGESYLRVSNLDVASLFAAYLPKHYRLTQLSMNVEAWTQWREAVPVHSQGAFSLRDLQLASASSDTKALSIDAASADFSLARESGAPFRLGLQNLRLAMANRVWPKTDLAMSLWRGDEGISLDLYAEHLPLDDFRRLAHFRPPDHAIATEAIEALSPRGHIRKLRLQIDTREAEPTWRASAQMDRLRIDGWRNIPAIDGLSGTLTARRGLARLRLDSHDSRVTFRGLFRDTLPIDQLSGDVTLSYEEDSWSVHTHSLVVDTPHLATRSRFEFRQRAGESPFLDLHSDFRNGDAAEAPRYYPAAIMGAPLVRWLDQSILGGRIVGGSALFHGALNDFAFEKTRSGSFQVVFDVDDVDLNYRTGWPPLENLSARVRFHGNQLDISGHSGQIYDSEIDYVDARIAALHPASPVEIRGRLIGPLSDNLRVLQEEALRDRFGAFSEAVRGTGNTRLDLDFAIPLSKKRGVYRLNGTIGFDGNSLRLPEWEFELNNILGKLEFTLDGLTADNIRANALGQPIRMDVATVESGTTRVRADADLPVDAIRRQLPTLPLEFATGRSDFTIDVDIPSRTSPPGTPTWLGVDSSLAGIEIDLPAPLGKPKETSRRLALRLPLNNNSTVGSVHYGQEIAARFSGSGRRIAVHLGQTAPALPDEHGIWITGRTARLDVSAWQSTLARLPSRDNEMLPPVAVDVVVDLLSSPVLNLNDVTLRADHVGDDWTLDLDALQLTGQAKVPQGRPAQPIDVTLKRLALKIPVTDASEPSSVPDLARATDPSQVPDVDLTIDALSINEAALGRLALRLRRVPEGVELQELTLRGGAAEGTADGRWVADDTGIHSALNAELSTKALGDLLVGLGYTRQLEEGPARIDLRLSWPGDPGQFRGATINGNAQLALDDGRLVELDPGVTRVVGLLNLNALAQRLRLDFSDLFKKGYRFYSITGDFEFADGMAATDNLVVLGPSGRIDLSGEADLLTRSIDQQVRVTPNFDATLPIASTIAGGPVAGAVVLVAQKLMAERIDDINRFEYRLSGPWADPEIEQLDSSGALSRLLKPLGDEAPAEQGAERATSELDRVTSPPQQPPPDDAAANPETPIGLGERLRRVIDKLKPTPSELADSPLDQD